MSTRLTIGALLNTVSTTANTVTNTLDVVNKSVGMLTAFVDNASENQKSRIAADRKIFLRSLINEKSTEVAHMNLKAEVFMRQSADHKAHFESAYKMFEELLDPAKPAA